MQTTSNLGLKKPGAEDVVNIEDLNSNSDLLDGKFGASSGHGHTGVAGDGPKIGSGGLAAGAATDMVIGNRTVSDTTAPTGDSGTPTTLFGWLANMIKAITGGATWRTLPGMTIAAIKTVLDAATNAGTVSTLMKRDASGRAQVAAPSAAADIARKDTVDAVQSSLNTHTALGGTVHGATAAPTVSTLVARDSAGRAQVVAPSVAADIANKGYVDTAVSGATIPDASLTVKGKVQLSSATNSTSEALAATSKAVKDAYDRGSAGVTAAAAAQSTADAAQTRSNGAFLKDGSEPMAAPLEIAFPHGLKARHVDGVAGPGGPGDLFLNYNNPSAAVYIGNYNTAWHSGNDGAGSGLDADTVRGKTALPTDGSAPITGTLQITNGAPIIQMTESDVGKKWFIVADGSMLDIREDTLGTTRITVFPGGETQFTENVKIAYPKALKVRHIDGANGEGIYLNYANPFQPIMIGDGSTALRNNDGVLEYLQGGVWRPMGGIKSVQRGVTAISYTSTFATTNVTISAVDLTKSFLSLSTIADGGGQLKVDVTLTSSTNLAISHVNNAGSGSARIAWEIVQYY
ncbi:MAG: hypothetical protein K0Q90_332 [Paenibacillaceae bacterium]|nr:hypothetical protein [Paenibacillaceae bacterium]